MRRRFASKKPCRAHLVAKTTVDQAGEAASALAEDLAQIAATIKLEQLDPRALVAVMTDVTRGEAEFTTGAAVREHWESSKIQRVSWQFSKFPIGWSRIQCPDGSLLFLKFNSERFQLLPDDQQLADQIVDNMPNPKKKHTAPPKKNAVSKPTTTTPTVVPPVKPPAKTTAKEAKAPKTVKKPRTTGNYKWLLRRLQAQAINALTTANNRAVVRDGLDKCETFVETRDYLEKAGVTPAGEFVKFLDEFFAATIDR